MDGEDRDDCAQQRALPAGGRAWTTSGAVAAAATVLIERLEYASEALGALEAEP